MSRLQYSPLKKYNKYKNYKLFYVKRDEFNNVIFLFKPYIVVLFAILFTVFVSKINKFIL